jgi:hypothetical protein
LLRYSGRMFEKNKLLKSAGEVLGKIIWWHVIMITW